jgi:predicted anti-sigma-YlaC factor YlaD
MTELNCENVRMSAMAIADGEQPPLAASEVALHVNECAACRLEVEQLGVTARLLDAQERRSHGEDLWPLIEPRLAVAASGKRAKREWVFLLMLALVVPAYKILALVPDREFSPAVKLVPLAVALVVFALIRENPFRIKTNLQFEGE